MSDITFRRWIILASVSAYSLTVFGADIGEIERITVSASRFEEPLADSLPQTSIVTGDQLIRTGASNVSEALAKAAGIPSRINLDGSTNAVLDLRGYGDTADNNVVILLNGVRLSENEQATARTSMIPLEMIDHVEITRGGNSVLYGDGATSGTINIVTKKHVGDLTVISGGGGSFGTMQSSFFHNINVGDDEFGLFGKQYSTDGYRQNSGVSEQSLGFNWNHDLSHGQIGALFFGSREGDQLPGALPIAYLNTNPRASEVPGYKYSSAVTSSMVTLFGHQRWESVEFSLELSQRIRTNGSDYNYDASSVASGYSQPGWTQSYGHSTALTNNQAVNPRVKISDLLWPGNNLIIGYDWLYNTKAMNGYKTAGSSTGVPEIDYPSARYSYINRGIYFRDELYLSDSDRLIVGYRREWLSEICGFNSPSTIPANSYQNNWISNGSISANELQFTHAFSAEVTTFIRHSQNYRLPNVDDNLGSLNVDANGNSAPLTPQVSDDIDLGVRGRSSGYQYELGYFFSDITNEISYDPTQGGNINFGRTRRKGLHLLQAIRLNDHWRLGSTIEYVDSRFVDGVNSGNRIPNVSSVSGNLNLGYMFGSHNELMVASRFAGPRYASGDFSNSFQEIPGYMIFALSYAYREKLWSLSAGVDNIFDKAYAETGVYDPYYKQLYLLTAYPNPGRSFYLRGRYVF